jgi:hypothetical protein
MAQGSHKCTRGRATKAVGTTGVRGIGYGFPRIRPAALAFSWEGTVLGGDRYDRWVPTAVEPACNTEEKTADKRVPQIGEPSGR